MKSDLNRPQLRLYAVTGPCRNHAVTEHWRGQLRSYGIDLHSAHVCGRVRVCAHDLSVTAVMP